MTLCPCDGHTAPILTPIAPGLTRLPRQIGLFGQFRADLLARVRAHPALRDWRARDAEDFGLMKDVTIAFLGFSEAYLGAFGKGKGENMWVTVPLVSSSEEPAVKDFVARIRKNAGSDVTVSHYVMTHYISMLALKAGLEKSGKIDREAVVDGMEGLAVEAPTGMVNIGAKDHHVSLNMYLAKTEGGGLKTVRPLGTLAPQAGCA